MSARACWTARRYAIFWPEFLRLEGQNGSLRAEPVDVFYSGATKHSNSILALRGYTVLLATRTGLC